VKDKGATKEGKEGCIDSRNGCGNHQGASLKVKDNNKNKGFNFTRAVNGSKGKTTAGEAKTSHAKDQEKLEVNNRFAVLEEQLELYHGSVMAVNESCPTNMEMEMDLGRILPSSILTELPPLGTRNYNISNIQKSKILVYITAIKAVPEMVANTWNSDEWEYFADQCHMRDYDPELLVVDDDNFMEDNLIVELEDSTHFVISEQKKNAITKALKSSAKAVKAKDMVRWSVGERFFFKDQVHLLGIDMNYAIEDVEDEENGMASLMGGRRKQW
ncbi:hypothetical protein R6Q59_002938, partial [Mikania micrantha]